MNLHESIIRSIAFAFQTRFAGWDGCRRPLAVQALFARVAEQLVCLPHGSSAFDACLLQPSERAAGSAWPEKAAGVARQGPDIDQRTALACPFSGKKDKGEGGNKVSLWSNSGK